MIRIDDPANLGPALAHMRVMLGYGLRALSRAVAERTGRDEDRVRSQISAWENGRYVPGMRALKPLLAELGYGLAFVPLAPETAPASKLADQEAEILSGPRVGHPDGSTGLSEADHCDSCGGPCRDESDLEDA